MSEADFEVFTKRRMRVPCKPKNSRMVKPIWENHINIAREGQNKVSTPHTVSGDGSASVERM